MLIALFFACNVHAGSPTQPLQQAKGTEQKAKPDTRGTEQSPLVIKVNPSPINDEKAAEEKKERQEKSDSDWWLVKLTGTLAAIGLLQLFVFGLQARRLRQTIEEMKVATAATQKAANAAKDSADTALVANMPVLSPYVTNIGNIHPLQAIVFTGSDGIQTVEFDSHIFFTFDNYGRTPGIIREVRADLFLVDGSKLPAVTFDNLPLHDHEVIIPGDARNGTGGTSVIDYKKHFSLTPTEFNKLLSEASSEYRRIVLIGRVIYEDFFEMRHTRLFCVWLRLWKLADNQVGVFQGQHGGIDYNRIERQKIS